MVWFSNRPRDRWSLYTVELNPGRKPTCLGHCCWCHRRCCKCSGWLRGCCWLWLCLWWPVTYNRKSVAKSINCLLTATFYVQQNMHNKCFDNCTKANLVHPILITEASDEVCGLSWQWRSGVECMLRGWYWWDGAEGEEAMSQFEWMSVMEYEGIIIKTWFFWECPNSVCSSEHHSKRRKRYWIMSWN